MSEKYEITGMIYEIMETQTFSSGFQKREFVVETEDPKYPQKLKFEVVKEKCALFDDKFDTEDRVTVHFNLRGSEYNDRYYVQLSAWKIDKLSEDKPQGRKPQQRSAAHGPRQGYQNGAPPPAQSNDDSDFSDIPF